MIKIATPFLLTLTFGVAPFGVVEASTLPLPGTAQDFSVLAASTITNTGATVLVGDLGVWPGTAITGSGSFSLTGASIFGGRALALNAAVTMNHNAVYSRCDTACNDYSSNGYSGVSPVPEPGTALMSGFGLLLLLVMTKLRSRQRTDAKAKLF